MLGRKLKTSPPVPPDIPNKRVKLWFNKGILFYLNLNIYFAYSLWRSKSRIIYANDTDSLFGAFLGNLSGRKKLVFDAHEYFSEVPELQGKPLKQRLWRAVENLVIPKAKLCLTVSNLVAKAYQERFSKKFHLIRNISTSLREEKYEGTLPEKFVLYQGALNLGRGIELMIDSVPYFPEDLHLVIVGDGDVATELNMQAERSKHKYRIHFTGRQTPAKVSSITKRAILGLSLEEDLGFNYRAALPNKIFSYLHAEIPCICSDLPEMKSFVESNQIGRVLKSRNPLGLAKEVHHLIECREEFIPRIKTAKQNNNWSIEGEKLKQLVNNVMDNS